MSRYCELVNFTYHTRPLRIVMQNGEPWWVAVDVCAILGIANARDALSRLDNDEKGVANADTLGGVQRLLTVSESGLYALVLTSRKKEAQRFRKWVTTEVLPSIRKTGRYEAQKTAHGLRPTDVKFALRIVAEARRTCGTAVAQVVWRDLGLPWVPEGDVPHQVGPDVGEIGRFIADRIERAPGVVTPFSVLWGAYLEWTGTSGVAAATQTRFALQLSARGFEKIESSRRGYRGLRLRPEATHNREHRGMTATPKPATLVASAD
jgi:prophage antirepressor-like protein